MRSCFLDEICALTAVSKYIAYCVWNPVACTLWRPGPFGEWLSRLSFRLANDCTPSSKNGALPIVTAAILHTMESTKLRDAGVEFHHQWCNSQSVVKSCVNEGLQRPLNVLLSGPFKKSFPASHGTVSSTSQARTLQGRSAASRHLAGKRWTQSSELCADTKPLPKFREWTVSAVN
jgi:hypothetical protein